MERGRRRAVVGLRVLREGVVLVGLHCSLACACGVAVGPFVRDCEIERRHSCNEALWWYLMVVGVVVELCSVEVVWLGPPAVVLVVLCKLMLPRGGGSGYGALLGINIQGRYKFGMQGNEEAQLCCGFVYGSGLSWYLVLLGLYHQQLNSRCVQCELCSLG
ncbi:hypothetical protein Taro_010612, partial [Colocasia esculenta]|nr:hypothetical protein [Colocasia esculenta]